MKIGELIMELGFNADSMKFNDFVRSVGELNMASIISAGSTGELLNLIKQATESAVGLAKDMRFFAAETGLSDDRMQSWVDTAKQVGVSGDVIKGALTGIVNLQTQMKTTGRLDSGWTNALFILNNFGKVRVSPYDNAFTQWTKAHQAMKNLSQEQQIAVVKGLGGSVQMLDILKESEKVWSRINSQPKFFGPGEKEAMREIGMQWEQLAQEIERAGTKLAIAVGPTLINLLATAKDLIETINKSWVGKILEKSGEGWAMNAARGKERGLLAMTPASWFADGIALALAHVNAAQQTAQSRSERNITVNIHGNDHTLIATHVMRTLQDWLNETHYQVPLRQH